MQNDILKNKFILYSARIVVVKVNKIDYARFLLLGCGVLVLSGAYLIMLLYD